MRAKFYDSETDLFSLLVAATALGFGATFLRSDLRSGRLATLFGHGVGRDEYLAGTWVAGAGVCIALEFLRMLACAVALLIAGEMPDAGLMIGAFALALGPVVMLSMVACSAVIVRNALAAVVITLGLLALGPLSFSSALPPTLASIMRMIAFPLPWLGLQREMVMSTLLAQHTSLSPALEVVIYRMYWALVVLALAGVLFRRRELRAPVN